MSAMSDRLLQLADSDLRELAAVLRARRLAAPFTAMSVQRLIASPAAGDVAGELQRLADHGFQAEQMAAMFDLLVRDRCRRPKVEDALDLVTTGPEVPGAATTRRRRCSETGSGRTSRSPSRPESR